MNNSCAVVASDRRHLWHPYASVTADGPLYRVLAAEGVRLTLDDGTGPVDVVDAMASWWCQVHGYRHPVLDAAVHAQVGCFSHVMFGGLTHDPAVQLAEQLVEFTPHPLGRIFLADSGSVAMEVACKLARQWQVARAPSATSRRTRLAALRGAYHGDTWGVMALCDPDTGMHSLYRGALQEHVFLPHPPPFDATSTAVADWVTQAREQVHAARDELAAIVVEPVLQGAGGMWPWSPAALRALRTMADDYELLLIADEIATGLGRTGRWLACDWADVVPDILVIGKAMTGGYLTQAAVITSQAVAEDVSRGCGALMHGPTFMANPLACAASLASLQLLGGPTGSWQGQVSRIEQVLSAELAPLRNHPAVADVRVLGGTAAVELAIPLDVSVATRAGIDAGAWLRPFNRLVYAMPPYICTDQDLGTIAGAMTAAVDALSERDCR